MLKRGHSENQAHMKRKRKRNGVSIHSSILVPVDPPPPKTSKVMQVLHTNLEDPHTVRKSTVPISRGHQGQKLNTKALGDDIGEDDFVAITPVASRTARRKRKRRNDSTKMETFVSFRPVIVDELIRRNGLQEHLTLPQCPSCLDELGTYRCTDCSTSTLYCPSCTLQKHESTPLHRLEFWNGGFFERATLKDLGYCFFLSHGHTSCPSSGSKTRTIIVVHDNGVHHVDVQFCTCTESPQWVQDYRQLMRVGWYPASFHRPKTAFTFDILDSYQKLSLQGKLNLYDYYWFILQKTDNCGQKRAIHRYHEMSRCARQWRNLKQIIRGGGGHVAAGLASVPDGAFAVECPACPHPDRNLPKDWDKAPEATRWLYSLFLAVDANFRLKLKSRGITDPEIGSGWSYFVEPKQYNEHISQKTTEVEAGGCSSDFHAVNQVNKKSSKDYLASGVVACVCARHCLMQKNAVGDLQRGERFISVDYIVASVLKAFTVLNVVISYDIICKWSIHFLKRMYENHPGFDWERFLFTYIIPKFHLPGHGPPCQTKYSFNYTKGVGRTHGETVEQGWANINLAALSTREMGPGARRVALNDSWSGWNWKKILGMGEFLLRSLLKALLMKTKHTTENKKFDATLPETLREQWMTMIRDWDSNRSNPNPYTHTEKASNLAEVRWKLAEADEKEIAQGTFLHEVPGSVFIRNGLEIEEQQRQLASAIKKKVLKSDHQIASVQERRNSIMRQIKKWQKLQIVYMPGILATLFQASDDNTQDNDVETAENVPLLLPSSLDSESRKRICLQRVEEYECEMRLAQLKDSLIELRHTRKVRRRLLVNHYTQVAGQGQRVNTRSRSAMNIVEARITKFVERYRVAYQALLQLDPTGSWQETFLELKDCDNRGPGKEAEEEGVGDGSYFRSWIWLSNPRALGTADGDVVEEGASDEEVNEMLRVEWTTSVARLERWAEEVELLQEEMRRVVMFLEWKSADWLAKVDARGENPTSDIQSGLRAYAQKQAAIFHNLAMSFAKFWRPTLVSYGLQHSWNTEYLKKHGIPLDADFLIGPARGIFKFRLLDGCHNAVPIVTPIPPELPVGDATDGNHLPHDVAPAVTSDLLESLAGGVADGNHLPHDIASTTGPDPPELPAMGMTADNNLLLEQSSDGEDSGLEDNDSGSEFDWDDDLDF